jgi:hypothetical protein
MTLSRREFLKLSGLIATSAGLAACTSLDHVLAPLAHAPWPGLKPADFLALNRLTFGPRAEERQRLLEIGLADWIEEQLAPDSIEDRGCALRLRNLPTLEMSASDLADVGDRILDNVDRSRVPAELRQATLLRQVYSRWQLYEVMVEFWNDHFNITTAKGDCFFLKTVDDREVIRKHALGSFRELLWASAHSPAMLVYLDNQANRKEAPNENYARELMELHTLGVDGGYAQEDVMELARCLTGWSVKGHFWRGDFTFDQDAHDAGSKSVLGLEVSEQGQAEAERVLDLLAAHPSTARFIATKLARRFLSDSPAEEIVARAAAAFTQSKGDIRSVLRVILLDGLIDPKGLGGGTPHNSLGRERPLGSQVQPKYKRPVNFIASALRMLDAETDGGEGVQDYLLRMGQTYFGWPTPDGYPDRSEPWQGNLMPRWQFAFGLVRDEIAGTRLDLEQLARISGAASLEESIDRFAALLLGVSLEPSARDGLLAAVRSAGASENEAAAVMVGGLLASPAFQWR